MEIFSDLPKFAQIEEVLPEKIEQKSFDIIRAELFERGISLDEKTQSVVIRAIHATADFDFAQNIRFSPFAFETAIDLLRSSCKIVTDTKMAFSGISQSACEKLGVKKACFVSDCDVAECASRFGVTRSSVCVDKAAQIFAGEKTIYVVGNAPTALVRLRQLFDAKIFRPALVVACPVGFVNVVHAKNLILESELKSIVCVGRKGGSTVASAIVNALLYEAGGR